MTGFGPPGKRFQGAVIFVKGDPLLPDVTLWVGEPEPLAYIGETLKFLNVPMILMREPTQPEGRITVQFEGGFPDTMPP